MTDTSKTAKTKKYPQIELPRPGLDWKRFAIVFGVVALLCLGLGLLTWWTQGLGGDHVGTEEGDFPKVYDLGPTWKFMGPAIVVTILAGLGLAWAWKRPVKPRIEMYEVDTSSQVVKRGRRRSSASTSLTRTTY